MRGLSRLLVLSCALAALGCAPEIGGRASFPVVSRKSLQGFERVATVDEMRCTHFVFIFAAWGDDPNHEALISDILSTHKGDAIADADLTFFSIPALLYNQQCARVQGTVVRRARGDAPPPPAPAPAQPVLPAQPAGVQ
jgi:hypothetical protein